MPDFSVSSLRVEFGATVLLDQVTFTVERGQRWGIVGRNGSGKTTLFNILAGQTQPAQGTVARSAALRVSLLDQYRDFGPVQSVWEAAAGPFAELLALEASLTLQAAGLGSPDATQADLDRYARDLERFERQGGYTVTPRIDAVLHGLGFDPDQARQTPLATLSGGERGRLGLVRQLVAPADVLLLDEPTNHLDLETTSWLEEYLRTLSSTLLLVSHDRRFMERVVDHVLHLDQGSAVAYAGGYAEFLSQRAERRLAHERAFRKQSAAIAAEEEFIRRNLAGQKSRQAVGRRRRLERTARLSPLPEDAGAMALSFQPGPRGGDQVLVAESVDLSVGGRVLLRDFSATVRRGDVIGLIGQNGTGKSTLLRAIVGEARSSAGEIRLGSGISLAYYSQDLSGVPPGHTLYDAIARLKPDWGRGPIQSHLGRFGFPGDTVQRVTDSLSGGERARIALAMMVLSGANLLIFDEPTNHLDVESIEALEDALFEYEGTVLLVSHDRALLSALATRLWVLHQQRITDYHGSFEEWEAASRERAEAARIAAREEEARRKVKERKRTHPATHPRDERKAAQRAAREAERELAAAELAVTEHEAEVSAITARLEDPSLYVTADGGRVAHQLAGQLEVARQALERAMERWARAVETVDGAGS